MFNGILYVPGTWYVAVSSSYLVLLLEPGTTEELLLRYHIRSTSDASRLSYAHDLGQAGLGAGREAGRPWVLATK